MRAILDKDIIVRLVLEGGVEIGDIPKGVGFERLRFNGNSVVDLNDLSQMWVYRDHRGLFELHAVELPGSQLLTMTYAQRKRLVNDNGTYRLKTTVEVEDDANDKLLQDASTRLYLNLQKNIGTLEMRQLQSLMLICALVVYARQTPPKLAAFFDKIIPHIMEMFPLERVEALLMKSLRDLKPFIQEYWNQRDDASGE